MLSSNVVWFSITDSPENHSSLHAYSCIPALLVNSSVSAKLTSVGTLFSHPSKYLHVNECVYQLWNMSEVSFWETIALRIPQP